MRSYVSDLWANCRIVSFYFGLVVFVVVVNEVSSSSVDNTDQTKGNLKFSLDLYKELAQVHGNLVTSPASLEIILALTYLGAKGSTARQIASIINKTNDQKSMTSSAISLLKVLKSEDNVTLESATGMFIQKNFELKNDFKAANKTNDQKSMTSSAISLLKVLKSEDNVTLESATGMFIQKNFELKNDFKVASQLLSSTAQNIDFSEAVEAARLINKWVEQATNEKIKNMVSEGSLSPFTKLMLINAVYFKAAWKIPFNKKQSSVEPFYITKTQKKDVPMMYMKKRVGYTQLDELESDVLELQYEGRNLSMVILLPREIDGLRTLENELRVEDITEVLRTIYPAVVEVTLPRFTLQSDINLNPTLVKLGLSDMFDGNLADFSGISETGLVVSQVKQKTFIEVNEKGTEAAVSTRVSLEPRFLSMPEVFKADHPFMFMIVNKTTWTILFMGHVNAL